MTFSQERISFSIALFYAFLWFSSIQLNAQCPPGNDQNMNFTSDGTFTVPANVTEITIIANGAQGGDGNNGNDGGNGATVIGTFSVSPNNNLRVFVGLTGEDNLMVGSDIGAGGGGGSAVINGTTAELLIVAGGGGGAKTNTVNGSPGGTNPLVSNNGMIAGNVSNNKQSGLPFSGGGVAF